MSSKLAEDRAKKMLLDIAAMPGNDSCADCKARAPRWASHNLGIFICVRCAAIHRKIGTHVTKVKSLTLDSWSRDQIESMRNNGNLKSNAHYNPNEARHPPPTNLEESERDSELETYIRSKYEFKRFVDRTPRAPSVQPQSSASSSAQRPTAHPPRAQSTPLTQQPPPAPAPAQRPPSAQPAQPVFSSTLPYRPSTSQQPAAPPTQFSNIQQQQYSTSPPAPAPPKPQMPSGGVWDDLIAVQTGAPLQPTPAVQSAPAPPPARSFTMPAMSSPPVPQFQAQPTGMPGMSLSPGLPFSTAGAPTPFSSPVVPAPTGYASPSPFAAASAQLQQMQMQQQQQLLQQQHQQHQQQQQMLQQQQQQQQQYMQQQQAQQQMMQQQQYLQQQQQQFQPTFNPAQFMPQQQQQGFQSASPFQAPSPFQQQQQQQSAFMPQQQQPQFFAGQQQPMFSPPGWPSG
ncbi:ArfGap-domain-containing protein [Exidia glandulosa HHB12029]|uniref:ArfGap-domain-containing protein n=1 Tax=Exidia glandulosa HHB12029 TaxID=1314781 RepID=A0A165N865_EXIGL|nr:ArfGap-domain-containing protein [Exidia glandulosa HHB12029]